MRFRMARINIDQFAILTDIVPNGSLEVNVKLVILKVMLEHFAVQTVGTARGILHCKTEGSQFNGIILPPVNVTELVTEDMILPIE